MAEEELIKSRLAAYRMLRIETVTVGVCGFLLFVFVSLEFAASTLLGGLAFILPNAVFIRFSLRMSATGSSRDTLKWFYLGEALKIVITILIFAVCIVFISTLNNIGLMFATYGILLLVNLVGLAVLNK